MAFKLNNRGVAHHFLLMLIIIGFGVTGVGYMVASHADNFSGWKPVANKQVTINDQTVTIAGYACKFASSATLWQVKSVFTMSAGDLAQGVNVTAFVRTGAPGGTKSSTSTVSFTASPSPELKLGNTVNQHVNNYLYYTYTAPGSSGNLVNGYYRPGGLPTCPFEPIITPPSNLHQTRKTNTSITLEWKAGSAGNSPLGDHAISVVVKGKRVVHHLKPTVTSYKLSGLKPNTNYPIELVLETKPAPFKEASSSVTTIAQTSNVQPQPRAKQASKVTKNIDMYDSVAPDLIPRSAQVVAGYVDNASDYGQLKSKFPNAIAVSISVVHPPHKADVLDIEPGGAQLGDALAWYHHQVQNGMSFPIFYGSPHDLNTLKGILVHHGVKRSQYRLWAYNATGTPHFDIIGEGSDWDAVQFLAVRNQYDESICKPSFFDGI